MSRKRSLSVRSSKRSRLFSEDADTIRERMEAEYNAGSLMEELPSPETVRILSLERFIPPGNKALVLGPNLCAQLTTTPDERAHGVHFIKHPKEGPEESQGRLPWLTEKEVKSYDMEGPFRHFTGYPSATRTKLDALIKWYFIAKGIVAPESGIPQENFCRSFDQALRYIHSRRPNSGGQVQRGKKWAVDTSETQLA